jgi:hypothetical protein
VPSKAFFTKNWVWEKMPPSETPKETAMKMCKPKRQGLLARTLSFGCFFAVGVVIVGRRSK